MKLVQKICFSVFLTCLILAAVSCSTKSAARGSMPPNDLLQIEIAMTKEVATAKLNEIAIFERDERKRQQVWKLKDESKFSTVAVGYDENDKIRYVTAFVDKELATERIRFESIADLGAAVKEIVEPHFRYIWTIPANEKSAASQVIVYGDNPEFLTSISISAIFQPGEKTESEVESED